jgi:HK97 gp10 family phage protein
MLEIKLTQDRFDALRGQLREKAGQEVRKAAFAIQADAQTMAPVDTGALRNSIYTVTSEGSDYSTALSQAMSANPDAPILPAISPEEASVDDLTAIVAVGAEYGIYVEMGTSRQAAQPYLGPAAEGQRQAFEQAMQKVLS